jgi:hypothetical protein
VRAGLSPRLVERALSGPALLLTGPPGAGKTTLLLEAADALRSAGHVPVYLDLFGAAASPQGFVKNALRALPAESFGAQLPVAAEIRRLADDGLARGADAVKLLFRLWAAADEVKGRRVVLLFDEATEIKSLAYFAGLREVHALFGQLLAARRRGTLLATSFPTAARKLWTLEALPLGPLGAEELPGLGAATAAAVARASFGWPRYVRVLLDARPHSPSEVAEHWAHEMRAGGRLESLARATHESLLLRSRGYGICKAVLQAVAQEEGLTLTTLVPRLGRSLGATRDYLQWLVGVDALRMAKKRYVYVDGMVRHWVRLHGRGTPATAAEIQATAQALILGEDAPAAPAPEESVVRATSKRDSLIEID